MKNKNGQIFFCLLLSAFLFSLSFPGFIFKEGASFFAWVCFIPLFLALDEMSFKNSFFWGFLYGILSYSFLVYWLWNYSPRVFFIAILFYGFLYLLLFPLLALGNIAFGEKSFIYKAFMLLSFEYVKTLGFLGFSYGVTGYTQWKQLPIIQISNITGVYGVSSLIIFTNALLSRFPDILINLKRRTEIKLEAGKSYKSLRAFVPEMVTALILILLFSFTFIYGHKLQNFSVNPKIKVCAVQHNENPKDSGVTVYARNIRVLCELTEDALFLNQDINLVVWPETAVTPSVYYQYYFGKDTRRINLVNSLLQYIQNQDVSFVIGNFHTVPNEATGGRSEGDKKRLDYNSALFFENGKKAIPPKPEVYSKNHLVPLSEAYPFGNKFKSLKNFMEKLGANYWEPGKEIKIFSLNTENGILNFSTPICFEDTFPSLCRQMVKEGSRCFINLTNDSWGKSEACQNQHAAMAVFRSVENRVPSVRSATSGVTCIIDGEGRIEKRAPAFKQAFVTGEIPLLTNEKPETFYTRYGDVFLYAVTLLTAVLLITAIIKDIIKICQNR